MKKYLLGLVIASMVIPVWASTIVNNSNKASPGTLVALSFEKAISEHRPAFFQASTCEEADKKYLSTENAIMIYNADVGIAALGKAMSCPMRATIDNTIFIGKSYLKICTNAMKPKQLSQAKTIGAASVILSKGLISDYNSNGLNLKGVPYGGSKNVLGAVITGDVDFGFIASGVANPAIDQNQIVCPYSTDPRRSDFVGNKFNLKIPTLPIVKVFYTTSKDQKFIESLKKSTADQEFQSFLKASGYDDVKSQRISQQDLDSVYKHIKDSYEFYWK